MDAVIRSVPLSTSKARLGGAHTNRPSQADTTAFDVAKAQDEEHARRQRQAERQQMEEAIRQQVSDEAAKLFSEEKERGMSAGFEAGSQKALEDNERALADYKRLLEQRVDDLLKSIEERHGALMEEVRSLAVDVAFAAVCRMVGSLSVSPAAIAGCVTEQLAQLPHAGPVTVALHPDDLEILRNSGHTLPLPLRTVTLQPDDTLSLGGCRVATDHGHYDASLETQLRRLKAVIEQHRQTVLRSHG